LELFKNIRKKWGRNKISKILDIPRKAKSMNYANAKSIGIVYEIRTKDYQFFVNEFVDYLREEIGFKTIITLGFYNAKEAPEFLDLGNKYQFINKTHLNWLYIPQSTDSEVFIQQNFDILIDLTQDNIVPIKYLVASSKAKFKIGRYSDANHDFFDFMISLNEKQNIKDFLNQVNHYLKQIKTV
jgi:hypothetical protein